MPAKGIAPSSTIGFQVYVPESRRLLNGVASNRPKAYSNVLFNLKVSVAVSVLVAAGELVKKSVFVSMSKNLRRVAAEKINFVFNDRTA